MVVPNLHPLILHLPIALLTVSFIFDLVGHITNRSEFLRTGWWTFLTGFVGLLSTVASGLQAEQVVLIPEVAREHFENHEEWAFVATAIYAATMLWRISQRSNLPKGKESVYLLVTFFGMAVVWATAWYGGELVYRFGVGVAR